MSKEEWLKIRVQENLPLDVYWEYYKEMGGSLDLDKFTMLFPKWAILTQTQPTLNSSFRPVKFSMEKAIYLIFNHFDKKFEV